jgi:Pre-toxin TG
MSFLRIVMCFMLLASPKALAADLREVHDERGTTYWVDPDTHRVVSVMELGGRVFQIDSARNYVPLPQPALPRIPGPRESAPVTPDPRPNDSTNRGYPTPESVLRSTAPVKPSSNGYAPSYPLPPEQQAHLTRAINEIFGPGPQGRDHTASEIDAARNKDLKAKIDADAQRAKDGKIAPYTLSQYPPTVEQIERYKSRTILDVPSVPDPPESALPYRFRSVGNERKELTRLYTHLYKITPQTTKRQNARELGLLSVEEADASFATGEKDEGKFYKELAEGFLDLAIGLDPVTGTARSAYELITGHNFVTGAALKSWEYGFAAINVLTLGGEGLVGASLKGLQKVVSRGARFIRLPEMTAGGVRVAESVTQSASRLLRRSPSKRELGELVSIATAANKEGGNLPALAETISGNLIRHGPGSGPLRRIRADGPTRFLPAIPGSLTVADTFRGGSYFDHKLEQPVTLYRVFSQPDRMLSAYWTREKPLGPLQATLDVALDPQWKNRATSWVGITVPAGTTIYEGIANEVVLRRFDSKLNVGKLLGGGSQVYLNRIVPPTWVTAPPVAFPP